MNLLFKRRNPYAIFAQFRTRAGVFDKKGPKYKPDYLEEYEDDKDEDEIEEEGNDE